MSGDTTFQCVLFRGSGSAGKLRFYGHCQPFAAYGRRDYGGAFKPAAQIAQLRAKGEHIQKRGFRFFTHMYCFPP